MKVLFVTSEAFPFAVSGGLGDVSGALPKALRSRRIACRVVMPLYGDIKQEYRDQMEYVCNFYVPLAWRSQYCGVFRLNYGGVIYYFLDNEYYFKRRGLYGYYDDGERFAFFSRAALEMLQHIDFDPDVIHTNDWQTALVNVYINAFYRSYPKFYSIKTLFTIHNIQYQGQYSADIIKDVLGLGGSDAAAVMFKNDANYMKGAIETADKVSTVSPTYAKEILDPYYAHGLDSFLGQKKYKLSGILNGIDYDVYNPQKDGYLTAHFSANDLLGKAECKKQLLEIFGLPDDGRPVVAIVSRLAAHKGFDLVVNVIENIVNSDMQVVILGTGEYDYENFFSNFAIRYPASCSCKLAFLPELAHKIYAGADMLLMPSRSEPCGLAQMIALRYGTIPIVRETGGLKDTIKDCTCGEGNGFSFATYTAQDLLGAALRANDLYVNHKEQWNDLVKTALECDYSWKNQAGAYIDLYNEMLKLW